MWILGMISRLLSNNNSVHASHRSVKLFWFLSVLPSHGCLDHFCIYSSSSQAFPSFAPPKGSLPKREGVNPSLWKVSKETLDFLPGLKIGTTAGLSGS